MTQPHRRAFLLFGLLIFALATVGSLRAEPSKTETVTVSKSCHGAPFDYTIRLSAERPRFDVYHLTYPSPVVTSLPQNNTVPADYYVPKGIKPGDARRPAVICLHILDGNEPLTDLMCSVLADRGIPAIAFKLPYYGARGLPKGPEAIADDPQRFVGAIAQAGEDIRRTIDVLASRGEVDPERIGITGVSLGGIIAATAAGAEPRLYRAGLILAGGDLPTIIRRARETRPLALMLEKLQPAEREKVESRIRSCDPLAFAAKLRDRAREGRVLMINAAEDEVIPRPCTEKLAKSLGIADRVVWLAGLGHYTAMAELPRALKMTADFFAQDLPPDAKPPAAPPAVKKTPAAQFATVLGQAAAILSTEPDENHCHIADLELSITAPYPMEASLDIVRWSHGKFLLGGTLPEIGGFRLGQSEYPWILFLDREKPTLIAGVKQPAKDRNPLRFVDPQNTTKLRMVAGLVGSIVMVPEMLQQWLVIENDKDSEANRDPNNTTSVIRITAKDAERLPGEIRLTLADNGQKPVKVQFDIGGVRGTLRFRDWQVNSPPLFLSGNPPENIERIDVEQSDVHRMFAASMNFALERFDAPGPTANLKATKIEVIARDPAGHGLLCRCQGKTILMVSGAPAQMGAAQGKLLRKPAQKITERVVYLIGAADTLRSGAWFLDRMAEIERRTLPHIPPRFIEECDALSLAAGVSRRDGRYANLFPERFHCSGVALRGKATAGGRVLHARVLDYMTEIDLQNAAVVQVFMPKGKNAWMSAGYAGFIGTVTAMNERGLAVGEMGGRGHGHWDGMPMSLLLRDIMERADTVDEALAILRAAPRTCEYYYVLSDRGGAIRAVECTPERMTVLKPGQQNPRLPHVPEDTVFISGEDRAKILSDRIQQQFGRIDVPSLIEIIKRPVSMSSNLHDAIFAPETLKLWIADAGRHTPACDEPYAHFHLRELIEFFKHNAAPTKPPLASGTD